MPGSIQDAEKKPVQNRPLASSTVDHILWLQSLRCYPWWEGQNLLPKVREHYVVLDPSKQKVIKKVYIECIASQFFFFFAWRWQHRNGKVSAPL